MGPTAISLMLLLHILAAFWLAAGVFAGKVVRAQGRKATSLPERLLSLRIAARLAQVFNIPGGILVGVLGIGLLHPYGWGFRPLWVRLSIALWALLLANGILYLKPTLRRMLAATEASVAAGQPTAELLRLGALKAPRIAADLNALGLVIITVLMVLKPG
ncbi:MAG: DUF2269 family protein [Thermoanaerobaculia bacterium]